MSEELENVDLGPSGEDEVRPPEKLRSAFAQLLDFIALLSLIVGVIAAIKLAEEGHDAVAVTLYIVGGVFSAAWWHVCAIVFEACEKYLGK